MMSPPPEPVPVFRFMLPEPVVTTALVVTPPPMFSAPPLPDSLVTGLSTISPAVPLTVILPPETAPSLPLSMPSPVIVSKPPPV